MRRLSSMLHRSSLLQVLMILACWGAGQAFVLLTGLRFPASILGLGVLLALLLTRVVRVGSVRQGARLLLADMLLFFVPSVPSVLNHPEFLGWLGVKVLLVIALGTAIVMGATALTVDLACRWGGLDEA